MESAPLLCPACKAELVLSATKILGFIPAKQTPTHCVKCGVKLTYDTAGGVYAEPPTSSKEDS